MIGLLIPAIGEVATVEVATWDHPTLLRLLGDPPLTWASFHPSSGGVARLFYSKAPALLINEPATRLIQQGGLQVTGTALAVATRRRGNRGLRTLDGLTVTEVMTISAALVLAERRALNPGTP